MTYESKKWSTVSNLAYAGELYIWNAWAGVESDRWTLSAYVDNILDEDSPTLVNDFPLFDDSSVPGFPDFTAVPRDGTGAPVLSTAFLLTPRRGRNYGLTLQWRFGG